MDNFSSTAQLTPGHAEAGASTPSGSRPDIQQQAPEQSTGKKTSDFGALAHIVKSSLGSGILAMPNAFRNGGLAFGLAATFIIGFICTYCVHLLVRASFVLAEEAKAVGGLDFAQTAQQAFATGPAPLRKYALAAKRFVNAALLCTYYSVSCVYVVFISESLLQVVQHHAPDLGWGVRMYMLVLLPVLAVLCLPPTLRRLAPFSILANVCIFVGFAITLYYIFRQLPDFDRPLVAPPRQWPLYFSTVIFALEGIGMVLPVANNMKRPQHFLGCPGVLNVSMSIVVALYAIIGFFGYLRYGNNTAGSITLNLPVAEPLAQAVKLLVAGAVLLTYGLLLFVPNSVVLEALGPKLPEHPTARSACRVVFKLAVACLSVGVAAAVPSLGPVISLVGAIFVSTLGLLCPAVIDTVMRWEKPGGLGRCRWRLLTNSFIVLMSLGALLTGTYTSVLEIKAEYTHS
ncbi:hypothetical protein R5R35_011770 [Gryllus longicercus]|uniref:Amino acid transporter transmembrane domain-containing protein n=1 Tax=Gryllus longicercus TaxID=2509291 RepID=A0AAN9Z661_9ORTH